MAFWPWSNKKVQPFIKGDADWQGWQPPGSWNQQQPQWCLSGFLTSSSRRCAWMGLGTHISRQQMKWSESHTCKLPPAAGASLEKEHWNLLTCQEPIYANRHRPHLMTAPATGVARRYPVSVSFFQIKALKGKDHYSHHSSWCLPLAQCLWAVSSSFAPSLSFFLPPLFPSPSLPASLPPSSLKKDTGVQIYLLNLARVWGPEKLWQT